jgi:hypothetical protein
LSLQLPSLVLDVLDALACFPSLHVQAGSDQTAFDFLLTHFLFTRFLLPRLLPHGIPPIPQVQHVQLPLR